MEEDLGKLLYEYSDAVSPLDMTKTRRRKHLKSFTAISNLICMFLITVWCVWNFVLDLKLYTTSSVVKYYVPLFVILSVVLLIVALSVFGLWGKFLRATSFYRPHSPEQRENLNELRANVILYDDRKAKENSILIYENAIILKVDGEKKFIYRSTSYKVTMLNQSGAIFLFFDAQYTGNVELKCAIPAADGYLIKKYLGDKLTELNLDDGGKEREVAENKPQKEQRKRTISSARIEMPALIAGAAAVVVGIILIVIGYLDLMNGMPPSVGGFVVMFGLLLVCLAFIGFNIVSVFFIKVAAGAMFIYMGLCFLVIIEGAVTSAPVTFLSLLRHPSVYAVVCLFFVSVGISFIPNAIKSLVEYLKYN